MYAIDGDFILVAWKLKLNIETWVSKLLAAANIRKYFQILCHYGYIYIYI